VGKLYNVLALDAAKAIVKQVNGLRQVEVLILSQIGRPIDRPLVATAAVYPEKGSLSLDTSQAAEAILDGYLANIDRLRVKLLSQEINLF
jgi:S-adenosylmethionine synthetase